MPFTFLSHQAPVLPLKIARPAWFDGTALALGSMMPDLTFLTRGTTWYLDAHTVRAQLWFCLPATVVATFLVKRVIAGPLGAHLPDGPRGIFADYWRLSAWRATAAGWVRLAVSALIGSFSHIALDAFTHDDGWVVQHVGALRARVLTLPDSLTGRAIHVNDLLQIGLTIAGAVVSLWALDVIARRRLIAAWYPVADELSPTSASRVRLVDWTIVGVLAGLMLGFLGRHHGGPQAFIIRVADLTAAGVAIGCAVALPTMKVRKSPQEGTTS